MVKYVHIYTGKYNVFKFLYVKIAAAAKGLYRVFVFADMVTETRSAVTQARTRI